MHATSSSQYPQSMQWLERARRIDAAIAARGGVLGSFRSSPSDYPVFAERAKGARLFDIDGREYVDLLLGFGSVVLGHAHEEVDDAVVAAIRGGVSPSLHTRRQVILAEKLSTLVPGAERALFLRTGSDATSAAVRISRAFTGRHLVARVGYNGWHDWCAPRERGVPSPTRSMTTVLPYNDLDAAQRHFEALGRDTACLVLMPLEVEAPAPGYIAGLRLLCQRFGALLVFDEVRTGFRLAIGGAQEFLGESADLVTLSKALGNGYTVSALTGRKEILDACSGVSIASAAFRSVDGYAAALATLDIVVEQKVPNRLWALGTEIQQALTASAESQGVPARAVGYAPMPFLKFDSGDGDVDAVAMAMFSSEMLRQGVLVHPEHHWFTCLAMTDEDVARVRTAADASFAYVRSCWPLVMQDETGRPRVQLCEAGSKR